MTYQEVVIKHKNQILQELDWSIREKIQICLR